LEGASPKKKKKTTIDFHRATFVSLFFQFPTKYALTIILALELTDSFRENAVSIRPLLKYSPLYQYLFLYLASLTSMVMQ
jgi:hypothetical protein